MAGNKRYLSSYYPNEEECLELLKEYGTPKHVIYHSEAVMTVAISIAGELNKKGTRLNIPLIYAATYLHDIARVKSKHDEAGAEHLEALGLDEIADIVRNHTFRKIINIGTDINEKDVLCMADRMVLEDKFVGPEKRMEYITKKALLKFGENKKSELEEAAEYFIEYIHELEEFIGNRIVDIVPENVK